MQTLKQALSARIRAWCATRTPREKDRPLHLARHAAIILPAILTSLVFLGVARYPRMVEMVYTDHIGQRIGRILAWVTSFVPFSIAETILVLLVLWLLGTAVLAAYHVVRGQRRFGNALLRGVLRIVVVAGVLVVVFYIGWGFNYARADMVHRMHWQDLSATDTEDLARICEELVTVTNQEYVRALGTDDCGQPSAPPQSMADLDAQIDAAYVRVAQRLALHPTFAVSRGRAKPILLSFVMSRLLILGFYSPWTGEANYNRDIPGCRFPEVIGHEKAHQRCITSEDEANFFGFLACASSDDAYLCYSGYFMAQRQLLSELFKIDRDRTKALVAKRVKGVQRDAEAIDQYIRSHVGVVSKAGHAVNNAYLKANRVAAGVQSYQLSAKLMLAFAQTNGGTCVLTR